MGPHRDVGWRHGACCADVLSCSAIASTSSVVPTRPGNPSTIRSSSAHGSKARAAGAPRCRVRYNLQSLLTVSARRGTTRCMDFALDDDQRLIVDTVRRFAERDLRTWSADADRAGAPPERLTH